MYSKSNIVGSLDTQQISESSKVRVFDTSVDYSNAEQIYKCVNLKTEKLASTPICVYDPSVDNVVSSNIIRLGSWEADLILNVVKLLQDNPSLSFLGIGCNVGVYTLAVAKFGRRVTALDANRKNLEMVATSLVKGNLTGNVRLTWNAISDQEETVRFNHRKGNIGALQMISGKGPINDSRGDKSSKAIVLDNLVPLFRQQSLVIKMDIETFELKAL
ncbi:hypothetical protein DPMN_013003 [Dreissena polymorpha]|uniref:Uncharacterized protein n=1 Tax=Dreissena polymorpha TaxID=45954 RepID=A0A9D4S3D2_DREPO|nr:hypothetical protein DPMN_013003 [Dreissena polymorpha]